MTRYCVSILSPTEAILDNVDPDLWREKLKPLLEYTSTDVKQLLNRHRQNTHWRSSNHTTWRAKLDHLTNLLKVPLYTVTKNAANNTYTVTCRPGSLSYLTKVAVPESVATKVIYPQLDTNKHAFVCDYPFQLYDYQEKSVKDLLHSKHGNVELCTGSGKSAIAVHLVRDSGLKTAVIVPGKENFSSLYAEFSKFFGAGKVGRFGDGKKEIGKPITICIGKSLSLLNENTQQDEADFFSSIEMIIVDESHTFATTTMSSVCHGILRHTPYRFFLSGTQERGKDEENLLNSIIGVCVGRLSTKDAVEKGYISHHSFLIVKDVPASSTTEVAAALVNAQKNNLLAVRRIAYLHNIAIARYIAQRTIRDSREGIPSLILVDEVGQIALLLREFKKVEQTFDPTTRIAFAHGETNKQRLALLDLPPNTAKSVNASIVSFNKCEKIIMIATGCVQTGASMYPVQVCYNFVGGGASNRIKTAQGAVGRSVRKWNANPYKNDIPSGIKKKETCLIVDFDVDEPQLRRHMEKRLGYYKVSGTPIVFEDFIVPSDI